MAVNESLIAMVDQYGNGTTYLEISEYDYQGQRYVKVIRRVVSRDSVKRVFAMPDYAAKNLAEGILSHSNSVDQYGNGTVYIELSQTVYNGQLYLKAIRKVTSRGKEKCVLCMPVYSAENMAKKLLKVC